MCNDYEPSRQECYEDSSWDLYSSILDDYEIETQNVYEFGPELEVQNIYG